MGELGDTATNNSTVGGQDRHWVACLEIPVYPSHTHRQQRGMTLCQSFDSSVVDDDLSLRGGSVGQPQQPSGPSRRQRAEVGTHGDTSQNVRGIHRRCEYHRYPGTGGHSGGFKFRGHAAGSHPRTSFMGIDIQCVDVLHNLHATSIR